jgi:hypothetical protein
LKDLIEEARVRTLQQAFNRNRSWLNAELKAGRVEDAWRRIEKLAAETEDSILLKGYLEMKKNPRRRDASSGFGREDTKEME